MQHVTPLRVACKTRFLSLGVEATFRTVIRREIVALIATPRRGLAAQHRALPSSYRAAARWLLALALVVVTAGCAGSNRGAKSGSHPRSSANPRHYVLQPHDLSRGYEYGDDSVCGYPDASEGDWPKLEPLFASERPNACIMELQWVWGVEPPYARGVTSAAYVFRDADSARRAFEARNELSLFTASLSVKETKSVGLGDEAKQLHGQGLNNPASGIVWRYGNVVALVIVEPTKDKAARELAKKQQARLERPSTSVPQQPENDPELRLDDPGLKLPVYWFGRSYDPPGNLPPLRLRYSTVGGAGPGQSIQLWYNGDNGVSLDTWRLDAWDKFRRTRLGRLIWDSPCARKTVVDVEGGRAEIFEGYAAPYPVKRPCPKQPPNQLIAHIYYDKVVVAVNMPHCYECFESSTGPYETLAAMKTLVRSLHPRPPRR